MAIFGYEGRKLLHLKRPRLFPILDRFVVDMLGARFSVGAEAADKAEDAANLIFHLRGEARANLPALRAIQLGLNREGLRVSVVRILDSIFWSCHPAAGSAATTGRTFRCRL